ncbi:hypothetical protein VZT92_027888 [Zoarces viviparus]|uniref:Uncharacterized protein n=1 Tax=Zoarces viviparus TaxID=48416 RepID=A0AAW1DWV1_ZOAVI
MASTYSQKTLIGSVPPGTQDPFEWVSDPEVLEPDVKSQERKERRRWTLQCHVVKCAQHLYSESQQSAASSRDGNKLTAGLQRGDEAARSVTVCSVSMGKHGRHA